jgi:hypothetical protein
MVRLSSDGRLPGDFSETPHSQARLHLARPFLLLDFHTGFGFAKMVSIAQGMRHARHRVGTVSRGDAATFTSCPQYLYASRLYARSISASLPLQTAGSMNPPLLQCFR